MSANPDLAKETDPRRDGPVAADLVTLARGGDEHAWDVLHRAVRPADLVHLPQVPAKRRRRRRRWAERLAADAGPPGRDPRSGRPCWLAGHHDPAGNAAGSSAQRAGYPAAAYQPDAQAVSDPQAAAPEHELLVSERHAALHEAFTDLSPCCQQLIALLIEDPPVPYAQISARLGIPVGSIGPTRARCLARLRRHPAIAALINADIETARHEIHGHEAVR